MSGNVAKYSKDMDQVRWDVINDLAQQNFEQMRAHFEANSHDLSPAETNCLFNNLEVLLSDFGSDREFISAI